MVPYQEITEGMDFTDPMIKAGFRNGDILLQINDEDIDPRVASTGWDMIQPGAKVTVLRNHTDSVVLYPDNELLMALVENNTPYMTMRVPVYIDNISSNDGAAKAGLLSGDRILSVASDSTPRSLNFSLLLKNTRKDRRHAHPSRRRRHDSARRGELRRQDRHSAHLASEDL